MTSFPLLTRRSAAVAAALLTTGTLAGCGGNGLHVSASGRSTPTSSASPSATASATPSATPRSTATPSSTPATTPAATQATRSSGPTACTVSDLAVSLQPQGAAAGSTYALLGFRNTSSTTCTMDGHPGVSFVGKHDGTQIGQPAARTGALSAVTLAPGESTSALLQVAEAGNYPTDACAPTTVDGLRVYPPDSRASVFVADVTEACQGTSLASPQMQVSAVGYHG